MTQSEIDFNKFCVGSIVECNETCPLRGITAKGDPTDHCYNSMALCTIVRILPDGRFILANIQRSTHANHNGLTIVSPENVSESLCYSDEDYREMLNEARCV